MSQNIAAFFDIDGTIYREALITELFKKLITHEIVPNSRWYNEVEPAYRAWDRRLGEYDDYLQRMVEIFKETIVGISHEHIDLIAKRVIEQKGDRVYQFTRSEMERHKKEGHYVIAISGSPNELVKEMASRHGFDDYRGTIYQVDEEGKYNGKITPMWDGVSKQKAMHELAEVYNLDLSQCWSYGDTNGDLTMFRNTGHAYAINPTRELLTHIKEDPELSKKMGIVVERKDMIYHMDIHSIQL